MGGGIVQTKKEPGDDIIPRTPPLACPLLMLLVVVSPSQRDADTFLGSQFTLGDR